MHWAAPLIGKPWQPNEEGPHAFDCWGLVRYVFRERHGVWLPIVRIDDERDGNVGAIRRASASSGWCQAAAPALEDDVILVREPSKRRHVGLVIAVGGALAVLHANGHLRPDGRAVGCVERQSLEEFLAGYSHAEYWRRGA